MTFGEKLKYYREIQNIGQEHLAKLSHISVSAIRKYESGERVPKEDQLIKLAHALHISPASLKDIEFNSFEDILPYLYEICKKGQITFNGEKDDNGNYDINTLSVRFLNQRFMDFFCDWANKKDNYDNLKNTINSVDDETTKELLSTRLNDMEKEIESSLVYDRLINNTYMDLHEGSFNIGGLKIKIHPSKNTKETYPPLNRYSDFLKVLYDFINSNVDFECCGVFERIWSPQAIITINMESIEPGSLGEHAFAKFTYYIEEFEKYKIETEAFTFLQDLKTYLRFIIKDRVIATAINRIDELQKTDLDLLGPAQRDLFIYEHDEKTILDIFNVPINEGGK